MKDWIEALLIYGAAFAAGKTMVLAGFDPFTCGWMAAAAAVIIRWSIADYRKCSV